MAAKRLEWINFIEFSEILSKESFVVEDTACEWCQHPNELQVNSVYSTSFRSCTSVQQCRANAITQVDWKHKQPLNDDDTTYSIDSDSSCDDAVAGAVDSAGVVVVMVGADEILLN